MKTLFEDPQKFHSQRVPKFSACIWTPEQNFMAPGSQDNSPLDILNGRFSFLSSKQDIGWPPDWSYTKLPKLWLYNLHYFEYLWCLDYSESRELVLDWIENYPLRRKRLGWQPYATSLRLMNLCTVFFGKYRKRTEADTIFLKRLWSSIFVQTEWLVKHLENHLLGNHLFENGAALALVGSCFSGAVTDRWLTKGMRILAKEIPEQILNDGMHFELSPMYHCRVMYVLAMLRATGNEPLSHLVAKPLGRMMKALNAVCHPDGGIALLNDSAFGIYNEPAELRSFCGELSGMVPLAPAMPEGCFALPDAGYYGWWDREGNFIICDFGRIGPDYIPGHAHADIFSFELSLRGHRVIVDAGIHDYKVSETRRYCRSTAAHNTVEIDEQDQCEMWGAFRVARRGYPHDVQWEHTDIGFKLSAWHDGYRRLRGRPVHYRQIEWNTESGLHVTDRISASRQCNVVSRLHLHPICHIDSVGDGRILASYPGGRFAIVWSSACKMKIEDGWHFPEFGIKKHNKIVTFTKKGTNMELDFQLDSIV